LQEKEVKLINSFFSRPLVQKSPLLLLKIIRRNNQSRHGGVGKTSHGGSPHDRLKDGETREKGREENFSWREKGNNCLCRILNRKFQIHLP
jgi:hypothetical protein